MRTPGVPRVLALMLPVTLGLGLIYVTFLIGSLFATLVSEQAPRAIDAAFRIYILPQGIFSVAVATVLFPTLARQVARVEWEGVRASVASGARMIMFVLLPAAFFLMVLAEPMVRLVFERGEFDAVSTALTSEALFFLGIGLAFNGASLLLARVFFALQQSWLPTKVALVGVAINTALDAALYGPMGVGGIPLATSISSICTCTLLLLLLHRRLGGVHLAWIVSGMGRIVVASAVSALMGWTVWALLDEAFGRALLAQIIVMIHATGFAALTYLATAKVLALDELPRLLDLMRPSG
jgi:putative peptidoglycan lipid II flippase